MKVGAVEFSVRTVARAKAGEALTQTAIAEFLRKAEQVAKGFKGTGSTCWKRRCLPMAAPFRRDLC